MVVFFALEDELFYYSPTMSTRSSEDGTYGNTGSIEPRASNIPLSQVPSIYLEMTRLLLCPFPYQARMNETRLLQFAAT